MSVEDILLDNGLEGAAMTFDEAMEWIDYNVIRSLPYMGDQAPVIIYEFM